MDHGVLAQDLGKGNGAEGKAALIVTQCAPDVHGAYTAAVRHLRLGKGVELGEDLLAQAGGFGVVVGQVHRIKNKERFFNCT